MENKDEATIKCNKCEWKGIEEDLIRLEDKEGTLDGCPNCKTNHYLMDLKYPNFY